MYDLLVDIYRVTEATVNREPTEREDLVACGILASFASVSGRDQYAASGAGVRLSARMLLDVAVGDVQENDKICALRTREGLPLPGHPAAYRVRFVRRSRRQTHIAVDLEALA